MSCPHGNHVDACDICDEVAAAYNSGVEHTKRQWVGLTDEEITKTSQHFIEYEGFVHGAVWAEAKLKEKNHD